MKELSHEEILLAILTVVLGVLLSWIGASLKSHTRNFDLFKEKMEEFLQLTEHRLTTVEVKQKQVINRLGEIWQKCLGLKPPPECENGGQ